MSDLVDVQTAQTEARARKRPRPSPFPWLDHLRRDRRGLPVPYINAWGPERIEVRPDPLVDGRMAAFHVDDYAAGPDFTKQATQRQRECMVKGLCQVCGLEVPWHARSLVVSSLSVDFRAIPGNPAAAVIHEPWLCMRCVRIATRWCPALIRRTDTTDLVVHPIRGPGDVIQTVAVGRVDGYAELGHRIAMSVKQTLRTLRIVAAP